MNDPWRLTKREHDAIQALVDHGIQKLAARAVGISLYTFRSRLTNVYAKMDCREAVSAAVKYDRWRTRETLGDAPGKISA